MPGLIWSLFLGGCFVTDTKLEGWFGDDSGARDTDTDTDTDTDSDCVITGDVTLTASGIEFVTVCAQTFDMGCTPGQSDCQSDESPLMPVTLTHDYYVSRTEVTQDQYYSLTGDRPSNFDACGGDCPVEYVTWHMAAAAANALSAIAGLTACYECSGSGESVECAESGDPYTCPGYRLLTEAEWEGAARCGEDTLYAGSDTIDDVAWYGTNSGNTTHPVASKDPNVCGLHDMSGNVLEWAGDWYDGGYYTSAKRTDPRGGTGSNRVYRGGGWYLIPEFTRVAFRGGGTPSYRDIGVGLRLARSVP